MICIIYEFTIKSAFREVNNSKYSRYKFQIFYNQWHLDIHVEDVNISKCYNEST